MIDLWTVDVANCMGTQGKAVVPLDAVGVTSNCHVLTDGHIPRSWMLPNQHRRKTNADFATSDLTDQARALVSLPPWRAEIFVEGEMTAADAPVHRYDPWYVKLAYGVFVASLVGVLAILHVAPNLIVR
jgi:hypothetical protein